jgi:AraC family transcriptional regulator, transcriptional activator of pobA
MATLTLAGIPESITKDLKIKGFKIHELSGPVNYSVAHGRRDFYKIGLITGNMTLHYGDRLLEIRDTVLFFVNPNIPHSIVRSSGKRRGYACLFTEAFIGRREWTEIVRDSQLFRSDGTPVIPLNNDQTAFLTSLFQKMLSAYSSSYVHKSELFKNCIELIIHEALRIQPRQNEPRYKNAATRMTNLFLDLLERQFPIEHCITTEIKDSARLCR